MVVCLRETLPQLLFGGRLTRLVKIGIIKIHVAIFVIVVVGGLGSLGGAFIASLLIGCIQTFSVGLSISITDVFALIGVELPEGSQVARLTITQLAPVLPYLPMVAILIFRPRGLMGAREN